jgi:hypothetical protein
LKLCGAILETPMEIRKSNKRIALRELNVLDQSPKYDHNSSNKKTLLCAQFEKENSPDQAINVTPGPEMESSISCHNTPVTGRYEIVKDTFDW